jgi:hypothetical protein
MAKILARYCLFAALALGLLVPGLRAASLQLRNGTIVQGKYMGGTSEAVNFMVNGQLKQYNISDILLIDFTANDGAVTSDSSPSAAPPQSSPDASVSTSAPATSAAPSSDSQGDITVPSGTHLLVRMIDGVDSSTNHVGDKFQASLAEPLAVGDRVLAPKDALVYGRLVESRQAGRIQGQSELRLELTGIQINNQIVSIVTSDYDVAGSSRGKQSVERTGVGAGIGAIIGAIAGGGKGAAIGAGVGAGTAGAVQVMTHGQQVRVPSETELDFTVAQPFTVPATF